MLHYVVLVYIMTLWLYVNLFYEIFFDFPMFYTIFDTYWRVKGGGGGTSNGD